MEKAATCHPELRHYCKGLCKNCYQRVMHKQRPPYLARYAARGRHFNDPPKCHPDRRHEAHGLCEPCYKQRLAANNPERTRAYSTEWRRKNPEKASAAIRNWNLKRKFGITTEQYEAMRAAQSSLCAICGRPEQMLAKRLAVDHDHETGQIRGLLCGPCNVVLGYLENPEWSEKASAYRAKYRVAGAA